VQVQETIQAGTLRDRRRGGNARARQLSPERRSEIASFARWNRRQREDGRLSDSEFIGKLVHEVRAVDPDLASFVKKASSLPFKYQERIFQILNVHEAEVIRLAQEALCKPA
jgi:hypothetical protein